MNNTEIHSAFGSFQSFKLHLLSVMKYNCMTTTWKQYLPVEIFWKIALMFKIFPTVTPLLCYFHLDHSWSQEGATEYRVYFKCKRQKDYIYKYWPISGPF